MAKMGHGISYLVRSYHKIGLIKWYDNKNVNMGSNYIKSGTPIEVTRYDAKQKGRIHIECPEIIHLYNKCMVWSTNTTSLLAIIERISSQKKKTADDVSCF